MIKRLLKQYRTLPQAVKATVWFSACSILQKGIQFFTVPILTRLMPSEEYGEYSVFISWYLVISIFASLNLWEYVLNNGMLKYENDRSGYLSSLQGLSTLLTVGLFVIYLPLSGLWEKATSLSRTAMGIMFLELLFRPAYEYWRGRERYELRYKGIMLSSLAIAVAVPLVSIPLVLLTEDKGIAAILGRVLPTTAVYAVPAVLVAVRGKKFYDKAYWKFALQFNLPLLPHFLSSIILNQSDRIMIASMAGEDKAGLYSVAYSAAMVMTVFNDSIMASFIPYTYQALKDKKIDKIKRIANYLVMLVAGMNLMLVCLAPEAIRFLGPEEYRDAMYVIPPVAMSSLVVFLPCFFACIEYYFEETKLVTFVSVGSAVLNIVLNAIYIPKFGYIAAGYTTLVSYVFYSLGHYIFMRVVVKKYMNGVKIYNEKVFLLITCGSIVLSFGLLALYDYPIIRYALVLAAMLVCAIKRDWIIEQFMEIRRKKT